MYSKRSTWILLGVLVVFLILVGYEYYLSHNLAGKIMDAGPGTKFAVGQTPPDIVGEDIDGKPMKLSDYRGKVVVLDFWGFW